MGVYDTLSTSLKISRSLLNTTVCCSVIDVGNCLYSFSSYSQAYLRGRCVRDHMVTVFILPMQSVPITTKSFTVVHIAKHA
jgi:hypothetical protein